MDNENNSLAFRKNIEKGAEKDGFNYNQRIVQKSRTVF